MDKHNRIACVPPGWLRDLLVALVLALGLTAALSDPIDTGGLDERPIPVGKPADLTQPVSHSGGTPVEHAAGNAVRRRANDAAPGAKYSGVINRDATSRQAANSTAAQAFASGMMSAAAPVSATSAGNSTTVGPREPARNPVLHQQAQGPGAVCAEYEQEWSASSTSWTGLAGKQRCYAVNLMSTIEPVVMPAPDSLADARQYLIYTSRFRNDGADWERLRVGFFTSRGDAQEVADALAEQYPQAWVAIASDEEVATALAAHKSKVVELAALEPASAAQPAAVEGRAATAAGLPPAERARRYPGYMWSQLREPSDVYDEDGNSIVEGAIQQGIDWVRLGSKTWFNTFVEVGLKRDSDDLDWNNENKLSMGGKLRYFGIERTLVSVGAKYDLVNRTESNRTREGFTYFADWYSYWNLAELAGSGSGGSLPLGFPGTTWGQLRYPASQFNEETSDTLIEGAIEQGIDWVRISENSIFNTFVEVDYTFDSKELEWNNKVKVAPGAKVKAFVAKKALLEIGAMYRWQYRTKPNRTKSDPVIFLNWSTSWDFGEFARKSFGNPR